MSAPHHYAFYRLESALVKDVEIETILPHLLERGVVPKGRRTPVQGKGHEWHENSCRLPEEQEL